MLLLFVKRHKTIFLTVIGLLSLLVVSAFVFGMVALVATIISLVEPYRSGEFVSILSSAVTEYTLDGISVISLIVGVILFIQNTREIIKMARDEGTAIVYNSLPNEMKFRPHQFVEWTMIAILLIFLPMEINFVTIFLAGI